MVIVRIDGKILKIVIIIALVTVLGFNIYNYIRHTGFADSNISQSDNASINAFLVQTNIQTQGYENIEIFDINKGAVIKKVPWTPVIQEETANYLKGITNLYTKFKPIPKKGYMVKIPLAPPVTVKNQWLDTLVDEVIIIIPDQGKPFLLVFEDGNKALFFNFEGDTEALLENLNLHPENSQ